MFGPKNNDSKNRGMELFKSVTKALDSKNFKYTPHPEKMYIHTGFKGDDLSIRVFIRTYADRSTLAFDCPLQFDVDSKDPAQVAKVLDAINEINTGLHYGAFTLEEDTVWFRYHYWILSNLSSETILNFLEMVVNTVDEYDGKLAQKISPKKKTDEIDWDKIYG